MAMVMFRKNSAGELIFYMAKKDLEEPVATVEQDNAESWGGAIHLADGSCWYIEPVTPRPRFPFEARVRRMGAEE